MLTLAFVQCDAARQAIMRHGGTEDLPAELVEKENAALMR
jgi:hypothetical protein